MTPNELLERMAITFKTEIGPAIEAEYPRTQAFLSAVVLQKLAIQLSLQEKHAELEQQERAAMQRDLEGLLAKTEVPPAVQEAFSSLQQNGDSGLCGFIEALYAKRETLGETAFEALRGRARESMRRSLDRRMEYAS